MDMRTSAGMATESPVSSFPVHPRSPQPSDLADLAVVPDLPGKSPTSPAADLRRSRLSLAEGALALAFLYSLIGAGVGALAGSVLLGLVIGFAMGVAAGAAILLISGASGGAERVDRVKSHLPRHGTRS